MGRPLILNLVNPFSAKFFLYNIHCFEFVISGMVCRVFKRFQLTNC